MLEPLKHLAKWTWLDSNTANFDLCSYQNKVFSGFKPLEKVVSVDINMGIQIVQPFCQILFHGIKIFISPATLTIENSSFLRQ